MTSNDKAWELIFDDLKILKSLETTSFVPITAKQINLIGKREARLMAKFDTKESLPQLFSKNQLNINAISNGHYIIFKDPEHQSFIKLPDYNGLTPEKFRPSLDFELQTLTFNPRMSESNAIDFAHHSKLLSNFTEEPELKLTTRGRFFSDSFNFQLSNIGGIDIKNVQIEVDAGYEGLEQFLIIEAKSSTRSTFNIRQLYYPYRHFQNRTDKKIRTILLSFSNGIYYFTEIQLSPIYYDYKIIGNKAIEILVDEALERFSIDELLSQETHSPFGIPVPQADDLNKVIDLTIYLNDNPCNKFGIAQYFEFDERQGDYYGNAATYIGLVNKTGSLFSISNIGKEVIEIKNRKQRNLRLVREILKTQLFNDLYRQHLVGQLDDQVIIDRIAQEGLTGTTPNRRKSTVKTWLNWITLILSEEK